MREAYVLLLLFLCLGCVHSFGIFSRPNPFTAHVRPPPKKQGALKLCPPGGSSFLDAFNLICPMRKKRSTENQPLSRQRRSANMEETMEQCCSQGCDFRDILPLCTSFW